MIGDGIGSLLSLALPFIKSVVSEVEIIAPTPLEVTQPQNITEIHLFSSWHTKSGLYFSSDFFLISNY